MYFLIPFDEHQTDNAAISRLAFSIPGPVEHVNAGSTLQLLRSKGMQATPSTLPLFHILLTALVIASNSNFLDIV